MDVGFSIRQMAVSAIPWMIADCLLLLEQQHVGMSTVLVCPVGRV